MAAAAWQPPASYRAPSSVSPAETLSSRPPRVPGLVGPNVLVQAAAGPSGTGPWRGPGSRESAAPSRGPSGVEGALLDLWDGDMIWAAGLSSLAEPRFGCGSPAELGAWSTPRDDDWPDGGGI